MQHLCNYNCEKKGEAAFRRRNKAIIVYQEKNIYNMYIYR